MRVVVGITGASSPILGIRTLEALRDAGVETHLVVSAGAQRVISLETDRTLESIRELAHAVYGARDMAAPIASGSFPTDGMVIAPCSMKALASVAHSIASDLVVRARRRCTSDTCATSFLRPRLVPSSSPR
jgi:flavin prenyltransferase